MLERPRTSRTPKEAGAGARPGDRGDRRSDAPPGGDADNNRLHSGTSEPGLGIKYSDLSRSFLGTSGLLLTILKRTLSGVFITAKNSLEGAHTLSRTLREDYLKELQ